MSLTSCSSHYIACHHNFRPVLNGKRLIYLPYWFQSTPTVKASRNIFQHSEASDADEQDEEKEDSEDEFESVHSDVEVHYDYDFDNINTTVKYNNNTPISIDRRQNRQDGRLVSYLFTGYVLY